MLETKEYHSRLHKESKSLLENVELSFLCRFIVFRTDRHGSEECIVQQCIEGVWVFILLWVSIKVEER